MDKKQVRIACEALHKLLESTKAKRKSEDQDAATDDLFEDAGQRVSVVVTGIKLPKDSRRQLLHV